MKKILSATAAAVLLGTAGPAFAGLSVSSVIGPGTNLFSDNSAEAFIDVNGNNILDVGDRLRGIFTIDTVETGGAATQIGGQSAYNELTGIYDIVVTSAVATGGNILGVPLFNYEFASSGVLAGGAAAILYEDAANDYAREGCATIAACEATATGGSVWASFDAAFWSAANAASDPSIGSTLPLATPLGTFGVGLNFLQNNTGFDWDQVNCLDLVGGAISQVDVCGQGGILASGNATANGANTPYELFNNVDLTAQAVPSPAPLALVGAGLLALAGVSRKARRAKSSGAQGNLRTAAA